jgi:hypothetical protein
MMPPAYWPRSASCSFMESARPSMVLTAISHTLYSWVVAGGSCRGGGGSGNGDTRWVRWKFESQQRLHCVATKQGCISGTRLLGMLCACCKTTCRRMMKHSQDNTAPCSPLRLLCA